MTDQVFSIRTALKRGVANVRREPGHAIVLFGLDALGVLLVLTPYLMVMAGRLSQGSAAGSASVGAGVLVAFGLALVGVPLVYLASEAAWYRFLTGQPAKPGIPWRLGADEGRLALMYLMLGGTQTFIVVMGSFALFLLLLVIGIPFQLLVMVAGELAGRALVIAVMLVGGLTIIGTALTYVSRLSVGLPLILVRGQFPQLSAWRHTHHFAERFVLGYLGAVFALGLVGLIVNALASAPLGLGLQAVQQGQAVNLTIALFIAMIGQLIFAALFQLVIRGYLAEAALTSAPAEGDATPPASPDAPCPVPEAV